MVGPPRGAEPREILFSLDDSGPEGMETLDGDGALS
jgi:hypothetical protein